MTAFPAVGAARHPGAQGRDRACRSATAAFVVLEAAGLITYLVLGRNMWFYSDEWDYVVDRHIISDPASMFRAHNGQWQTIPIIVFRALWQLTALHTYWPYLVLVVLLYLVVCALLYAVMLRARVRPWISMPVAGTAVFLGFASGNIVYFAQLTYFGSIACGLGALLLVTGEHTRRRDVLAVCLAVAALMCSNLGVVMAVVVACETLLRRGWRAAALITAPVAAVFVLWWALFSSARGGDVVATLHFVWVGVRATGRDFSQHGDAGFAALAVVLVAGLALAAVRRRDPARIAAPLLLGTLAFWVLTGSQRAGPFGAGGAAAEHYVHVGVLLMLPVAGVAADSLYSRFRPAGLVAVLILLVGVPGNVSALSTLSARADAIDQARQLILAVPRLPAGREAPADLRPFPESGLAPLLTVGFIRTAARRGWLPPDGRLTPPVRNSDEFRLALYQTDADPGRDCRALTAPIRVRVSAGSVIRLAGGFASVTNLSPGPEHGLQVYYNPNRGNEIKILRGDYLLQLASRGTNGPARLCAR